MFETIGKLITIVFWLAAIALFGFGLIGCGSKLFQGDGIEKFLGILGIGLGALAFYGVYQWLESILWSMLVSGIVLDGFAFGNTDTDGGHTPAPKTNVIKEFTHNYIDAYTQKEIQKEAYKDAIRELEEGR